MPNRPIALLYPGDRATRDRSDPAESRFAALFDAFAAAGIPASPAVYHDDFADEVEARLLDTPLVLVWCNPIEGGRRRDRLDAMLRRVADSGVVVSAHPDTILKLGTKDVLFATRDLPFGSDVHRIETLSQLEAELPARLAEGPRVLKQHRGHSGIGIWRVENSRDARGALRVRHAQRGSAEELMSLPQLALRYDMIVLDHPWMGGCVATGSLLPLDDCLYALQATIPHLTRSSLHRCLQRHGISRLPETAGDKPAKKRFKPYPIGYFHIDIAEVRTEQGKLYLFVAIDRTSKFAFAELHEKATRRVSGDFLRHLIAAVPYRVHTVLTDNGTHFTTPGNTASAAPLIKAALDAGETVWAHAFEYACAQNDIDHRLTKPRHPWTNGQVERMNCTLKDATVRRYHYDSHDQLRAHLSDFVTAYNFARQLKTLKGLTPYEFICKRWTREPERFRLNPLHQMPGLNI